MTVTEKEEKGKYGQDGFFGSQRHDYMTPLPELINPLLKFINISYFTTDVCCSKTNIPASIHYFDGITDGLKEIWKGICWLNPPYKTMVDWIKQAYFCACEGKSCEVWAIVPARTETVFWKKYISENPDCFVVFLKKELCFIDPATNDYVKILVKKKIKGVETEVWVKGKYKNPLAIVYFGKNAEEYAKRWNQEQPLPYQAWRIAA